MKHDGFRHFSLRCALTKLITANPTLHCLSHSIPTYILSECVLVYMEPAEASQLVKWLGAYFSNAAMVVYEQVGAKRWVSDGSVIALSGCPQQSFS